MSDGSTPNWVDAHFHLFNRKQLVYSWLDKRDPHVVELLGDYSPLDKVYLPEEFLAEALPSGLKKAVHVEAAFGSDPVKETAWVQSVADRTMLPIAIIGRCNLTDPQIESLLDQQCAYSGFRGVRMMFGANEAASSAFQTGFRALVRRGLIYEIASAWSQCYEQVAQLADEYPDAQIVLEHCGMPRQLDDAYLAQ